MANRAGILAEKILEIRDTLAPEIVKMQYDVSSEQWEQFDSRSRELSIRDTRYHLNFLIEAIRAEETLIFQKYIHWLRELFYYLNFSDQTIKESLRCMKSCLSRVFNRSVGELISEYIDAGYSVLEENLTETSDYLKPETSLTRMADAYISTLLNHDKYGAQKLILDAIESGVDVTDIFLNVLQKAQWEVGRRWMKAQLTVADEHYISSVTQSLIERIYPYFFNPQVKNRSFLGCCVQGELHDIGVQILSSFFEKDGWKTINLGANMPSDSVIRVIERQRIDVVGISVSMPFHQQEVIRLITGIRSIKAHPTVKILVGGQFFRNHPEYWKKVGANGFAMDAEDALRMANSFF